MFYIHRLLTELDTRRFWKWPLTVVEIELVSQNFLNPIYKRKCHCKTQFYD